MAKAKKAKSADNKLVDVTRDVIYASLGVQKAAYEFGVDKYETFTKERSKNMRKYIKRGEQLEAQIKDMYTEFKGADHILAKGIVSVEEQVEKAVKLASDLSEKVSSVTGIKPAAKPVRKRAPAKRKSTAKSTRKAA